MKRFLLTAAVLPVVLGACQRELPAPEPEHRPRQAALQTISVCLMAETPDSKSVISVDAEEFRKAYLFAFDADTRVIFLSESGRAPIAVKTTSATFDWPLPSGLDSSGSPQPMDVYAIVNPDTETEAALEEYLTRTDLTETHLESLEFQCQDARSLLQLEDVGMPMSGKMTQCILNEENDALELTLKRLFARYDLRINIRDFVTEGWTVSAAEVLAAQSNTRAPFFYTGTDPGVRAEGDQLSTVDFATEEDILALNSFGADDRSTEAVTLYFLENCQGDIGPASKWNRVFTELGPEVAHCSYVDILVEASDGVTGRKKFKYRFYPGQDAAMCANFDIIRNRHRSITLKLHPREASENFQWVYDGALKVAPGESLQVRFETSLPQDQLRFQVSLSGLATEELQVSTYEYHANANQASPGHTTYMPHYGIVTLTAQSTATDGQVFSLYGGDGADLEDTASITIDSSVSFWKDVHILRQPAYRGQWMVVQLPENVFGVGHNFQAGIAHFSADDGVHFHERNSEWIDLGRNADIFGLNGKTGIRKPHLWYDHTANRLYVYAYTPDCEAAHYNRFTLLITCEDPVNGEEFEMYRKNLDFTQRDLQFCLLERPDVQDITVQTWITEEHVLSSGQGYYFALTDPGMGYKVIDNRYFEWGGDGQGHSFTGLGGAPYGQTGPGFYRENFFLESQVEYEWDDAIDQQFHVNYSVLRDIDAYDFDFYDLDILPKRTQAFPYDENRYLLVAHSFFPGQVRLFPVCELIPAPRRRLVIQEAVPGTNDYAAMHCSQKEVASGSECYLMYGFRQTYYVRMDNLPATPAISASIPSGQAPYLQYALTPVQSGLYRLDLWVDRYENPRSYEDTAVPYDLPGAWDPLAGDKRVTLTVRATYLDRDYEQQLVCTVLHKRFRMEVVTEDNKLSVQMWNPLGFVLGASAQAHLTFERYWRRHPLKQLFDGPYTETQTATLQFSNADITGRYLNPVFRESVEQASADLKGIRCDYAVNAHPAFQAYFGTGSGFDHLILYYPHAWARDLSISLTLDEGPFHSTVPGLSLYGISSFRAAGFISFPNCPVQIQYLYSTLSEYYLQAGLFENYNLTYYGYYFQTPAMWTEYTNMPPPLQFPDNRPEHLGGPDTMKTVSGYIHYGSYTDYEIGNAVIDY